MTKAWERQKNETSKAYGYFVKYRDSLPEQRSMEHLRKNLGIKVSQTRLEQLSSKYNWVARAQAYDDYIERKKRQQNEKKILEMHERHAKIAMMLQNKLIQRMQELNPGELTARDIARWVDVAIKVERLSRGEPTEIGKQEVQGQVKQVDDQQQNIIQEIVSDPELAERIKQNFRQRIRERTSKK